MSLARVGGSVRSFRAETQARQRRCIHRGSIAPGIGDETNGRYADCERERISSPEVKAKAEPTSTTSNGQRERFRGRRRAEPNLEPTISTGLATEDILVYVERGDGRRNRRYKTASTLTPKPLACCKARDSTCRNHPNLWDINQEYIPQSAGVRRYRSVFDTTDSTPSKAMAVHIRQTYAKSHHLQPATIPHADKATPSPFPRKHPTSACAKIFRPTANARKLN